MRRPSPENKSNYSSRSVDEMLRSLGFHSNEFRPGAQIVLRTDGYVRAVTLGNTPIIAEPDGTIRVQYDEGGKTHVQKFTEDDIKKGFFPEVLRSNGTSFVNITDVGDRATYSIEGSHILPDGTVEYDVLESVVPVSGSTTVAERHKHVPAELLRTFQRVLFLRDQVRVVEENISQIAHEHRQSFQTQKNTIDTQVMQLLDKMPDLKDMVNAGEEDIRTVQEQLGVLIVAAEQSLNTLQSEISLKPKEVGAVGGTQENVLTEEEKKEVVVRARQLKQMVDTADAEVEVELKKKDGELTKRRLDETKRKHEEKQRKTKEKERDLLKEEEKESKKQLDDLKKDIDDLDTSIRAEESIIGGNAAPADIKEAKKQKAVLQTRKEKKQNEQKALQKELRVLSARINVLEDEISSLSGEENAVQLSEKDKEAIDKEIKKERVVLRAATLDALFDRITRSTDPLDKELVRYIIALRQDRAKNALSGAKLVTGSINVYDFDDPTKKQEETRRLLEQVLTDLSVDESSVPDVLRPVDDVEKNTFNFTKEAKKIKEKMDALLVDVEKMRQTSSNSSRLVDLQQRVQKSKSDFNDLADLYSSLKVAATRGVVDKQMLRDRRVVAIEATTKELLNFDKELHSIQRELTPQTQKIEIKGHREFRVDSALVEEVLRENLPAYTAAMNTLYEQLAQHGSVTPDTVAAFGNIFPKDIPPALVTNPQFMRQLREAGIKNWDSFKTLWDTTLAKKVADAAGVAAQAQMRDEVTAQMGGSFWEQMKQQGISGNMFVKMLAKMTLYTGGTIALGMAGASALLTAAAVGGGLAFIQSRSRRTGATDTEGFFGKLQGVLFGSKKAEQERAQKNQEAYLQKRIESVAKLVQEKQVGDESEKYLFDSFDRAPMMAAMIAQTIRQETVGSEVIEGVTLTGDARDLYRQALREVDPQTADQATRKQLAEALVEMQARKQVARGHNDGEPVSVDWLGKFVGALQSRDSKDGAGDIGNAIAGAAIGASYAASGGIGDTLLRGTVGFLGGAHQGVRRAEQVVLRNREQSMRSQLQSILTNIRELMDVRNFQPLVDEQEERFDMDLRYLRRIRGGGLSEEEQAVYASLFDPKTKKPTALYGAFSTILSEAEAFNLKYRISPELQGTQMRLQDVLAQVRKNQLSESERAMYLPKEMASSKEKSVRAKEIVKAGAVSAVTAMVVGGVASLVGWQIRDAYTSGATPDANVENDTPDTQVEETLESENAQEAPAPQPEPVAPVVEQRVEPVFDPNVDSEGNRLLQTFEIGNDPGEANNVWGTLDRMRDATGPDGQKLFETPQEFRQWRADQLEALGYRQVDGRWGHPFTVHDGAKIELFVDNNGDPHARLIGETEGSNRTITVHDHLRFRDVSHGEEVARIRSEVERPAPPLSEQQQEFIEQRQRFIDNDASVPSDHMDMRLTQSYPEADLNDDGRVEPTELNRFADTNRDGRIDTAEQGDLDAHRTALVGMALNQPSEGGGRLVSSDIPTTVPDRFTSDFPANNPDVRLAQTEAGVASAVLRGSAVEMGAMSGSTSSAGEVMPTAPGAPVTFEQLQPLQERQVLSQMGELRSHIGAVLPSGVDVSGDRTGIIQSEVARLSVAPSEVPLRIQNGQPFIDYGQLATQIAEKYPGSFSPSEVLTLLAEPTREQPFVATEVGSHALSFWWGGMSHTQYDTGHMYAENSQGQLLRWETGAPRESAMQVYGWQEDGSGKLEPILTAPGSAPETVAVSPELLSYISTDVVRERSAMINIEVSGGTALDTNTDFVSYLTRLLEPESRDQLAQYYDPMIGRLDTDSMRADWIATLPSESDRAVAGLLFQELPAPGPGEEIYGTNGSHAIKLVTESGEYVVSDNTYFFGTENGDPVAWTAEDPNTLISVKVSVDQDNVPFVEFTGTYPSQRGS